MSRSRDRLLAHLEAWTADPPESGEHVAAELVHKHLDANVALSRIATYDPDHPDARCVAEVRVDQEHAYFFEHPIDHVPGLLLIEVARQTGVAAAHSFRGVPLHAAMIVDELHVRFDRYAELDHPLFVALAVDAPEYRKERFVGGRLTAEFLQGGETIGEIWMRARLMWWVR